MNQTDNVTLCVDIKINPVSDVLMAICIMVLVLGITFHSLTAWPIVQQICSKNILAVYLFGLSVSDMLYILTMPSWIYYYHNDHKWTLDRDICKLTGFFYYSNMYISIYLLCCISIDRCLMVTFPLRVKAFRHYRNAWLICGLIYVLVMSIHSVILKLDTSPAQPQQQPQQQHCYETYPMTVPVALLNFLRVSAGFLLPLLILTVCYCQILCKVQKSVSVDEHSKRKIKLLSVGVIAIFSICFTPYHILLLARSVAFMRMESKDYCNFEQKLHLSFSSTLALSSLNSVMDPLLYVLVSNGIREDMKRCCWRNS
ncbi:G protein-coupled receptor 184 [Astyanax mexicanus]|uniref:G protein-coupled receptor 184 n=1 Tax=Astyanax mexicanus TaxID=7994 RepID=UPI000BBD7672|nr:G protein-coupled receptor 184 [Astyanax mexicanus]